MITPLTPLFPTFPHLAHQQPKSTPLSSPLHMAPLGANKVGKWGTRRNLEITENKPPHFNNQPNTKDRTDDKTR